MLGGPALTHLQHHGSNIWVLVCYTVCWDEGFAKSSRVGYGEFFKFPFVVLFNLSPSFFHFVHSCSCFLELSLGHSLIYQKIHAVGNVHESSGLPLFSA